ncbi:tRNA (adenosine(37)-N6)-threonylcarbamoyltransferase complex transferase subunit TsaD [Candidatus Collierbacteria bacterium]|nr:tRNA (adenosine(37)-N6)-threonylcarbamoyltransferase complex transferase subunit TsaD [Candidatus Collierbacteria bacterium]
MTILSIDTSCDETAVAVTDGNRVLSNIIWSQALLHSKWGGVVPSLAKRAHQERLPWVVSKAVHDSRLTINEIDAIAATIGPGLAIALEVGIAKAKELALKWHKPLIPVNHLEGHILSPLAWSTISNQQLTINNLNFPFAALVVSGGHTELVLVKKIGEYQILVRTIDDALGEALDKAARMLGLGYPGGAVLEKLAKTGNPSTYKLPLPLLGRENQGKFSYSGLKTAFYRLTNEKSLTKQEIYDLAASFQNTSFEHLIRIVKKSVLSLRATLQTGRGNPEITDFLVGGGVASNIELRKRLRNLGKKFGLKIHFPYSKKLCTDNAAMIGLAGQWAFARGELKRTKEEIESIDRIPGLDFSLGLPLSRA